MAVCWVLILDEFLHGLDEHLLLFVLRVHSNEVIIT